MTAPNCRKCGSPMAPGIALANTMTGTGDFGRDDVVTMSPGGPGKLIDCDKCTACGWSVSPKTPSLPVVVVSAPERIFLVIGEDCPPEARWDQLAEVTWCEDNIDGNGIAYQRQDLAASAIESLQAEVERLTNECTALRIRANAQPVRMDQCETYCATAKRLTAERDAALRKYSEWHIEALSRAAKDKAEPENPAAIAERFWRGTLSDRNKP